LAYLVGSRSPAWMLFLQMLITLAVLVIFVREAVRAPYFNPRIRWWEAKPRYAITLNVALENERLKVEGETYNISVGGFFIISDAEIQIDEVFKARLSRNGAEPVECAGKVVWLNSAGKDPPQGFGFVFTEIGPPALGEIRRYIRDQKRVMKDKARARDP
jgi:Tfp pilus assembly protein PilZ